MKKLSSLKQLSQNGIQVFGAREHNLQNIDVFIPRNKITLITGLSGSGKSSLAFDTLYGEGQRRYLESLSVYARYFMDQLKKPKVDGIYGLSPSVAIQQKSISTHPRSTVGTLTEAYDFLRLLYAKVGEAFCPTHQLVLCSQTAEEIATEIEKLPKKDLLVILSPIARGKRGSFSKEIEHCLALGMDRARINGRWKDLGQLRSLERKKEHYIEIAVDFISEEGKGRRDRIERAVQQSLELSGSFVLAENKKGLKKFYSLDYSCPACSYNFIEIEPKLFSFNSPKGACPNCNGVGRVDLNGEPTQDEKEVEEYSVCPECQGTRLRKEALQVKLKGLNIDRLSRMNLNSLKQFLESLKFSGGIKLKITDQIRKVLLERLAFLDRLSLGYLSLHRPLSTLSGGEAQRVRMAGQLSSPVIGLLYVLDEPSIGLHPKDQLCVLEAVKKIRDRGNTVIMVEHDEASICQADNIVDLGPGAGKNGGFIAAQGSISEIKKNKNSLTGAYLSGRKAIPLYKSRYLKNKRQNFLQLKGLRENNLKNISVDLPLSCLIGISGVSGSGKSSLVTDTLYPLLFNRIYKTKKVAGKHTAIKGESAIDQVVFISQRPIGRGPRSNPATYTGVFQMIRIFFSGLPAAHIGGWSLSAFSFNVSGGRCENCRGAGSIKLEMRFLPDVYTPCPDCGGKRYHQEILNIRYKGKNINDVLNMTVEEAASFFKNHPYIYRRLEFLKDVGLGYIILGQSSLTLSGGEAQRIKLARELSKGGLGKGFYILDEPTTGLHFQDVERLVQILRKFAERGHTVLVIEHNLDV